MKISIRQTFFIIFILIYQPVATNSQSIEQLTSNGNSDINPKIILDNQNNLWVFFASYRSGNWDIYAKRKSYGVWSGVFAITTDSLDESNFDVKVDLQNNLWIAWEVNPVGYILIKKYDGVVWSPVDTVTFFGMKPKISFSSSKIWIFWNSYYADVVAQNFYSGTWSDSSIVLEHYGLSWLVEYFFLGTYLFNTERTI